MKHSKSIEDSIDIVIDAYNRGALQFVIDQINATEAINKDFTKSVVDSMPRCRECEKPFVPDHIRQSVWAGEFCSYECYWFWCRNHD